MFGSLMASRRFAPLFWCQFFAAFNDNFLRNALIILIVFKLGTAGGGSLVFLTAPIFILPSFVLSGLGGELADRFDKAVIARRLKFSEIAAAAVGVAGFILQSVPILFAALFLFGALAALFTPVKYGLLPDHLARRELPAGNALIEGATFLAILLGTIAADIFAGNDAGRSLAVMLLAVAVASWIASRHIPPTGEEARDLVIDANVFRSSIRLLGEIWGHGRIWRANLIASWFWAAGAVFLPLVPTLTKEALGGDKDVSTIYLVVISVGIAAGSALASWLASGRIILLPSPIGMVLMGIFMLDLASVALGAVTPAVELGIGQFFAAGPGIHIGVDLFGIAVAGGLIVVPAFAAMQAWSPPAERARTIGGYNIVSAGAIVASGAVVFALRWAGLSAAGVFLVLAAANFVVGALFFRFLPTNPLIDFLSIVFRAFYRLEVKGDENLQKGGANPIIALNHVNFLDAALALSLLDRQPIFAIDYGMAQLWWVRPLLRFTRAMPLDPSKPIAIRTLINAVKGGDPLIIFPEGRLTVTGSLMKVYDGAGLVADKCDSTIIPVKIDGLEHSRFTRLTREQVRRVFLPKVTVTVLEPVKLTVSPELKGKHRRQAVGAALYQIMSDLVFRTTATDRTIIEALVGAAVRHGPQRVAVEDPTSGGLSYRRLLAGSRLIGTKLMPFAGEGQAIGVMLPNANAAAVAVLGLISAGRVPAMINFSSGSANILAACRAAEVKTIVTARAFIEKARLERLVEAIAPEASLVYLEDIRPRIRWRDRLAALWRWRHPLAERKPDDPAAILFTSGSEGTPKGVVLSHRNILANAAQGAARIDVGRTDKVFNVLPLFHSFGLTVGFILPLLRGVRICLYPSPLHYRIVAELIYGVNATILLGTDTFLTGYAKKANPYDFRSLRYVLAGAEPVKESTRRVYSEKFGLRILEGYGATETAAALAVNTPMFNRYGTVGRILPGMEVRLEPVPGIEDGGRLFVRGPNVMLGYLRAERPGVIEPPNQGWYDTGDIVDVDPDGFVTIKGRAKRFAKIGGEMVSLAAVEALVSELWPDWLAAVSAVPDERKGERLILVTDNPRASRGELIARARASGMGELMVPSEVMVVERVPVLGSGKVDNVAVGKLVAQRVGGRVGNQPEPTRGVARTEGVSPG